MCSCTTVQAATAAGGNFDPHFVPGTALMAQLATVCVCVPVCVGVSKLKSNFFTFPMLLLLLHAACTCNNCWHLRRHHQQQSAVFRFYHLLDLDPLPAFAPPLLRNFPLYFGIINDDKLIKSTTVAGCAGSFFMPVWCDVYAAYVYATLLVQVADLMQIFIVRPCVCVCVCMYSVHSSYCWACSIINRHCHAPTPHLPPPSRCQLQSRCLSSQLIVLWPQLDKLASWAADGKIQFALRA